MVKDWSVFLSAAKAIFDEKTYFKVAYAPDSVNAIAEDLLERIGSELLTIQWIESVAKAHDAGQPIVIDFDDKDMWSFYTMKSGSRDDLVMELIRVGEEMRSGNMKVKNGRQKADS